MATWCVPYCDGLAWSSLRAYSGGTGADSGSDSAPMIVEASGLVSLKTIVWESGVWIPAIGPPLAVFAPTTVPK